MNTHSTPTAVIIGASSGIGEALAHELNRAGWRLGLLYALVAFILKLLPRPVRLAQTTHSRP